VACAIVSMDQRQAHGGAYVDVSINRRGDVSSTLTSTACVRCCVDDVDSDGASRHTLKRETEMGYGTVGFTVHRRVNERAHEL